MTIMPEGLPFIKPIDVPIDQFPHDAYVPEGCIVHDDLSDVFQYQIDLKHVIYASPMDQYMTPNQLEMYIYIPTNPPVPWCPTNDGVKFPTVVFCQGSAFHKQWIFDHLAHHIRLAQRGYVVASIRYRASEEAPFPAQCEDYKTAVRFLRKNADQFHVDPDRIGAWGDSSGGHTVLMAGFTGDDELSEGAYSDVSSEVKCIVDWYGPTDFALMNSYPSSQYHLGADTPEGFEIGRREILENLELVKAASPMTYLHKDKKVPPTLIMHGGNDWLVPFNQSVRLYEKMRETGQDVTFIKLEHASHGCMGFHCEGAIDIVDDFLRKHLV